MKAAAAAGLIHNLGPLPRPRAPSSARVSPLSPPGSTRWCCRRGECKRYRRGECKRYRCQVSNANPRLPFVSSRATKTK
jgi:hypothetical protein